ncbi:MAG: glycerol-3-phosphate dehydrogenase [Bdellovibrionaceae bacterium]|nr:glycerol-3-phosphate dehydrogenase [Pseudobdellovibrionaceae bacterium]
MSKDFWRNETIAVMGGGAWGSVLVHLASAHVKEVRLWVRSEDIAREMNSTHQNSKYLPGLELRNNVRAFSEMSQLFDSPIRAILWVLPSRATRGRAKEMASFMTGEELIIHATKGVEEGTLKRVSTVLLEELPCLRVGALSGPNLAKEIADGEPAATVIASSYEEVIEAGTHILSSEKFSVFGGRDLIGVEWAGALKNILAIASGALDAIGMGRNVRALLISRGIAEMVRFGEAMGAQRETFLGLAGVGDLLATCSSDLSRNYRVGYRLGKNEKLTSIIRDIQSTAEGVRTTKYVWEYARERGILMPITHGVYQMIMGEASVEQVLDSLTESHFKSRLYEWKPA